MVERVSLPDLDGEPHAVAFPGAEPKTVRLSLSAGESVPEHDHPDRQVLLYLLEGRLSLELNGESHEVTASELVRFDGDQPISPRATEPSTALIVLAPRAE
ncbi:cupin domain-containing protein [Halorubrum sp. DTA98]|uniref:cupin domain-containing protein n=1 Tax=Halorubrum sp. DTA98 TaxID=3402163 RepID=UPI003AAD38DA